ncbi:hypothetical protein ACFSS9_20380 [Paenibacillus septentrionalis]|uniref:hypothetical protein n=1 Tax=Paenibacillus septentrionalis TaxID=429342 RepID=UPI003639FAD8
MKDQDHQSTNQGNQQSYHPSQLPPHLKEEQDASQAGYRNIVDYGVWLSPQQNEHQSPGGEGGQLKDEQKDQIQTAPLEPIPTSLDEVLVRLETELGYKKSFDVAVREMTIGRTKIAMLTMSGLSSEVSDQCEQCHVFH